MQSDQSYYGVTEDNSKHFDAQTWDKRYIAVSELMQLGKSVIDLCGGDGKLQFYIQISKYQCVDITKRCANAIVADFNKKEFPYFAEKFDYATCLGGLEYLDDVLGFLQFLRNYSNTIIVTYNNIVKKSPVFKNAYTQFEIQNLLNKAGWEIQEIESYGKEKVYLCKNIYIN